MSNWSQSLVIDIFWLGFWDISDANVKNYMLNISMYIILALLSMIESSYKNLLKTPAISGLFANWKICPTHSELQKPRDSDDLT